MGGEEKLGDPPPNVTLFFCQVIAFTCAGDLGRFNHTISSPGQLNQIGQINNGSTGEMVHLSPILCVFVPVCSHTTGAAWLTWHLVLLTRLNLWLQAWS